MHFPAEFDSNKPLKFTGTISKMEWTNPHVWLHLDVKGKSGQIETWAFKPELPTCCSAAGSLRNR
jgi:hypothetical protein